ncbi:MAG: Peptidyl-prolyl cis-trans isomerase [Candidatus Peregrinibacteria bacterium GW2011_GWA2_44_7]|nr:MAG: Peptidyl-prolyl cis-trans isomerase [Candidatus Peregrinibacteria bacterium GW2011_GWA2_44_7]
MKKNFSFLSILIILAMTLASTGCSDSNSPAPDAGGYVTNSSGLKYKDIMVGTGDTAEVGKTLSMHYVGTLTDGSKFE